MFSTFKALEWLYMLRYSIFELSHFDFFLKKILKIFEKIEKIFEKLKVPKKPLSTPSCRAFLGPVGAIWNFYFFKVKKVFRSTGPSVGLFA